MEKTKHTPAPWKIGRGGPNPKDPVFWRTDVLNSSSTIRIARVSGVGEETSKANARLIAAAPDLLEACRELWFAIQVIPVDWNNPEAKELSEKAIDAMDGAELAMNRAEGRE